MALQKLPLELKTNGFTYIQKMRTRTKAMYESSGDFYEVFRIVIKKPSEVFGKKYPRREVYPSSEDFGHTAWCYTDYERALRCYNQLK